MSRVLLSLLVCIAVFCGGGKVYAFQSGQERPANSLFSGDYEEDLHVIEADDDLPGFAFSVEAGKGHYTTHQGGRILFSVSGQVLPVGPPQLPAVLCRYLRVSNSLCLSSYYGFLFRLTPF